MAALVVNSPLLSLAAPNGGCQVFSQESNTFPRAAVRVLARPRSAPAQAETRLPQGYQPVQAVNPSPSKACQSTWPSQNS